jgi:hypothetical protein
MCDERRLLAVHGNGECHICAQYDPTQYDPVFVDSILKADAAPVVAKFDNVIDMLNWLDED